MVGFVGGGAFGCGVVWVASSPVGGSQSAGEGAGYRMQDYHQETADIGDCERAGPRGFLGRWPR